METNKDYYNLFNESLEALKNSPIVSIGYNMDTQNLCDVIVTLSENVNIAFEDGCTGRLKETMWQIQTLASIIKERLDHVDYETLDTMFACYNKVETLSDCSRCDMAYKVRLLEQQVANHVTFSEDDAKTIERLQSLIRVMGGKEPCEAEVDTN